LDKKIFKQKLALKKQKRKALKIAQVKKVNLVLPH